MIILPEREATSIHQSPSFNQQGHATVQAPKKLLLTAAVDSKSTLLHAQQEARGRGDDGENRGSTKRYLAILCPGSRYMGSRMASGSSRRWTCCIPTWEAIKHLIRLVSVEQRRPRMNKHSCKAQIFGSLS